MKKILGLASLLFSFGTYAQTASNGGIHLQKGQVINALTTTGTDVDMGMGSMKNDMSAKMKITIIGEDANTYTFVTQNVSMKISVDGMGQSMTFDSDKPEDMNGEMGKQLGGKLNKVDTFLVTKTDGKVTKLSVAEEEENPFMMGMGSQNSSGSSSYFMTLPTNTIGKSWSDSVTVKNSKIKNNYTLQSIENGIATIKMNSTMDGTNEIETQGMTMNMTINLKTDAILKLNTQTGIVISNNSTADMTGNMDAMGQQIPINSKITSSSTLQ